MRSERHILTRKLSLWNFTFGSPVLCERYNTLPMRKKLEEESSWPAHSENDYLGGRENGIFRRYEREREREKRDTRAKLADERDSNSDSSWDGSRRCFTREIQPLLVASETDLRYSRGREDDGEPWINDTHESETCKREGDIAAHKEDRTRMETGQGVAPFAVT